MEQRKAELKAAGLQVVAVALGEVKHAQRYCPQLAPSVTCIADQDKTAYAAYGLRRAGLMEMATPDLLGATIRALSKGHVGGQITADPMMLPGTFVVDRDGVIQYAYYSKHAGDHPEIEALLNVARLLRK